MKAKYVLPLWLLAAVFSAVLLLGCSKSKLEEQVPYWVEQGEPAENSKEELVKWHQESVDLLKAVAALEVTSAATGKKRKVIIQTASTLEKAEAMAFGRSPEKNRKQQGEKSKDKGKGSISSGNGPSLDDFLKPKVGKVEEKLTAIKEAMALIEAKADEVAVFKASTGGIGVLTVGRGHYLAEAILQSVGNFASFINRQEMASKDKKSKNRNVAKIEAARVGPFKIYVSERFSTISDDTKSFHARSEMSTEYKVEGKTGSLIARSVLKVEDTGKVALARVNRSFQEDGLSMVDFAGGLLEEENNIYTLIICADKKGEEFSVYLIFNKENSDKEKAGSDE